MARGEVRRWASVLNGREWLCLGSYRIATVPKPNSFFGESVPSTVNSIVRGMNYGSALTFEMTGGQ